MPINFKEYLDRNSYRQDANPNRLRLYRGHNSADWKLYSSYSRFCENNNYAFDLRNFELMLDRFTNESSYYFGKEMNKFNYLQRIALAQHYGVPTPFLDWTESPYIAVFFAIRDRTLRDTKTFTVWRMEIDRKADYYLEGEYDEENLPNDFYIIKTKALDSKRIWKQQGYFSYLSSDISLNDYLDSNNPGIDIIPYEIIGEDWVSIMKELKLMGINHGSIFDNLDGIARDTVLDFCITQKK